MKERGDKRKKRKNAKAKNPHLMPSLLFSGHITPHLLLASVLKKKRRYEIALCTRRVMKIV
jgi:hypothetical protein